MEQPIVNKSIAKYKLSLIEKESQFWLDNNIISNKQRVDIIGCYSPLPFFASFLTVAGACLIGLAILSYIASNWDYLSAPQKIAVILTSYLAVALPGVWAKQKELHFTSSIFFLLSSFVFGGGLFLISQTFHDGQPFQNLLLWWLAGVVVVFLLTKDRLQLVLSQVIAILYFYATTRHTFFNMFFSGTDVTIWNVLFYYKIHIVITLILWACVYRNLNRLSFNLNILISLMLLFGLFNITYRFDNFPIVGLVIGLLFIIWLKYHNNDLLVWGLILTTIFGMILTMPEYWNYTDNFITIFIKSRIGLSNVSFYGLRDTNLTPILCITSGLIACVAMIAPIFNGSIAAMVLFPMFVMRFYFDTFYDFLPKTIFFAIGGLLLIGFGIIAKHIRARSILVKTEGGK